MPESIRTVAITGVSRGLGRALAEEMIRLGHRVTGCARDPQAIREWCERAGSEHLFHVVDVAEPDAVRAWATEVLARFGPPDLLCNNAALMNTNAPLWQVPEAEFQQLLDVNLRGTYQVACAFLPSMIARGSGVIVNFSSGWGRSVSVEVAPYCASKWGVEGLTRALAMELPHGLAAIPLNPGVIDTDMLRSCWGEEAGSYGRPEEWARRAAPFLLSLGPKDNGKPLSVPDR